jgi:hypothetical protein
MVRSDVNSSESSIEEHSKVDGLQVGIRHCLPIRMVAVAPTAKSTWRAKQACSATRQIVAQGKYKLRNNRLELSVEGDEPNVSVAAAMRLNVMCRKHSRRSMALLWSL